MKKITLMTALAGNKRIILGMEYLKTALEHIGYEVSNYNMEEFDGNYRKIPGKKLYIGIDGESQFITTLKEKDLLLYHTGEPKEEGFYVADCAGDLLVVSGGSDTGALYGCLSLEEKILEVSDIPDQTDYSDAPVFKLRGPAIGLQKTKVEPPRLTYEYPITPERFPWFYDRALWSSFLDMMLRERCNILYLWTGHPFSSLIKMPEYPEAQEVTDEEMELNHEIFSWLTEECDRRGIWVVLKFYSIHIPLPFAQKHGLDLHQSSIHPLVAEYTRKAIAQFIASYPHIGLMVCLGEALRGVENKTKWFTDTVLPGVKDGIELSGLTEMPPVILRGHDCDPKAAMTAGKEVYDNIYTMWKYNGEGLTTYQPRGKWQTIHEEVSALSDIHIINVHILADLEPFRFGSVAFIQKCVQASMHRLGANGLHLYPLFFWDWPYSPDNTEERLLQINRDWLWYKSWFRYAWNPDRDQKAERIYWSRVLGEHFGCDETIGEIILDGIAAFGECAPRILRRVGITEGNRQTFSLGMAMSQFTNVTRFRPNYELWNSVAPQGEPLDEFVKKELTGEMHVGETPEEMIGIVSVYANKAVNYLESIKDKVTKNTVEYSRFYTDALAIHQMTMSYFEKLKAAIKILSYKYTMDETLSGNIEYLIHAKKHMEESLEWYRKLTDLTKDTYLYANSMQTKQRKIPFPNGDLFGHWVQCLPKYEAEYENFCNHLEDLKVGKLPSDGTTVEYKDIYQEAEFEILSDDLETYTVKKGQKAFIEEPYKIEKCAEELIGLTGVRFLMDTAVSKGQTVKLKLKEDSIVLLGYYNSRGLQWLQVPDLETNTHADDRGGLSPVIQNAVKVAGCPMVNIHAFHYVAGIHEIYMGTGGFMIAGVLKEGSKLIERNAQMTGEALESLDWMYEE